MRDDDKDAINHIFAIATTMLEDAITTAASGQSPRSTIAELARLGQVLKATTHDIGIIAEAAMVLAQRADDGGGQ